MSVNTILAASDAALIRAFELAGSAAAPSYSAMTPERIRAFVAAGLALIGVVIGGLALARPAGRFGINNGRRGVVLAMVAGLIGVIGGGLVVATADGGLGTGNGLAGGVVAILLGLIAVVLGGLVLTRCRRTA